LKIPSLLFAVSLLAAGCKGVYATRPVGEKPAVIVARNWEGTWMNEDQDQVFRLSVRDAEKGILEVSDFQGEAKKPPDGVFEVFILQGGERLFASMKDCDHPERETYLWGQINKNGNRILIWAPDHEKFKDLVEKGLLPGKAEDDAVILGDLKPEHYAIISSDSSGVLYDWENPIVLIREVPRKPPPGGQAGETPASRK
jgi:hypothetical protein